MTYRLTLVSGQNLDPMNIQESDIQIEVIAHALAGVCRYNGHTADHKGDPIHYSVAQHCVLLSQHVPEHLRKAALLHDASEAFCGDLIAPYKQFLPEFTHIEEGILRTIFNRYNVPFELLDEIHEYDKGISISEMAVLLPHIDSHLYKTGKDLTITVEPWSAVLSKAAYMMQFYRLFPTEKAVAA